VPVYAAAVALILLLWGVLTGLSFVSPRAAHWLTVCGVLTALAGVVWQYQVGAEEGVERLSFLAVRPTGLIFTVVFLLIELSIVPVFSVVIACLYFDRAWRPFLVEVLGVTMCASGILLSLR
jgi:hypothetical protein